MQIEKELSILKKYQKRLVNFNARNQSLCRSKIVAKRSFDLNILGEELQQKLFNELMEDSANPILLARNPSSITLTKIEKEEIIENIKEHIKNRKIFEAHLTKIELDSIENGEEDLKRKAIDIYQAHILEKKIGEERKLVTNLAALENTINSKEKETGLYELYTGLIYLEGRLEAGETIRAPLLLFPSRIFKQDGDWWYENLNNKSIFINKTFLLAYKESVGVSFDDVIGEYETIEEALEQEEKIKKEDLFSIVELYLKKIKIMIKNNNISKDLKFEKYVNYTASDYEKYGKGQLDLKNHLILGEYSIGGNSIYNDYEKLLKEEKINNQMKNLLFEDTEVSSDGEVYRNSIEIKEEESFFLTELDYSQEKAVKLAEDYGNLVVYGPPGTGKSQVIANIVSGYLAKRKKILVVSEKRTALDVVYKRLETYGLGERLAFIHDIKSDYQSFMEKIISLLEEKDRDSMSYENTIEDKSKQIEIKLKKLDKICNILHNDTVKEISLFRLYSNSSLDSEVFKEILDDKDEFFNSLKDVQLKEALLKLKSISTGLKYDKDKWLSQRKNLASFPEKELLDLVTDLKELLNISEETINKRLFTRVRELLESYLGIVEIHYKNKISIEKNKLMREIKLLDDKTEIELKKFILNIENELKSQEENLSLKVKIREIFISQELNSLEDLKDNLLEIEDISQESIDNIEKWNYLKTEYEMTSMIVFWKKNRLKKEILGIELGDSLDEKLKLISKIAKLKRSFKSDLEKITIIEKIKNKNQLLRSISGIEENYRKEQIIIKNTLKNSEFLSLKEIEEQEINELVNNYNENLEKKSKLESDLIVKNYINEITKEKQVFKDLIIEKEAIFSIYKKNIETLTQEKKKVKELLVKFWNIEDLLLFINTYNELEKYELPIPNIEKEELDEVIKIITKFDKILDQILKYINITKQNYEKGLLREEELNLKTSIKYLEEELLNIISYDLKKGEFNQIEKKLFSYLFEKDDPLEAVEVLKNSFYLKWIDEIEQEKTNKNILVNIRDYNNLTKESFNSINDKKKLIPKLIRERLDNGIEQNKRYSNAGRELFYKDILREATKKRKKLPLRQYIEKFSESVFEILPCWLLTPEVASQILPLKKDLFDIVIYDEASQILVETAIPTIYRGKKIVVAGDDKQLQPTLLGKKRINEDEDEDEEEEFEEDTTVTEVLSLLDLAKERYAHTILSYHYRAKYPELINFSNYAFYEGKLVVAPSKEKLKKPPIERIMVKNGIWTKARNNEEEAEVVYKLVKDLLLNREEKESIGIITFNSSQQTYIREYLDYVSEEDIEFRTLYEAEKNRIDGSEDKSIFIKNIENVQGDEREIIIFSVGYAPDSVTGRVVSRFGSLSMPGGENRLNVAVSRAKKKCYVVTSIEPESLNVETTKNEGPKLLKKFLQYSRAVSEKNTDMVKTILRDICIIQNNKVASLSDSFESPFEEKVCNALREKGLEVHTQIGDSGYRIDLGIYSITEEKYILGIECDGAMYHSSKNARERDIYRQKFLEMKGWTIHRIWSKDWWRNPNLEVSKILNVINNLKSYINDDKVLPKLKETVEVKIMSPEEIKRELKDALKDEEVLELLRRAVKENTITSEEIKRELEDKYSKEKIEFLINVMIQKGIEVEN